LGTNLKEPAWQAKRVCLSRQTFQELSARVEVLIAAKPFKDEWCEHGTSDASLFSATRLMRVQFRQTLRADLGDGLSNNAPCKLTKQARGVQSATNVRCHFNHFNKSMYV